ncbi:S8 family serine peptidase [Fulvivirgaceae bacterium BMA12]|uniref:S8 family serine peptidase n=1 Tax=Agaribacillus aureus TaxID=3051825 RepID=A0ABT8LDS0_9BACT|nr:S8 family serine peptidase [Fulvivirgaceae bacterium BMA12]
MIRFCCILLILFFSIPGDILAQAPSRYWITFADKGQLTKSTPAVSDQAINNRKNLGLPLHQSSDLPIYQPYIDSLASLAVKTIHRSKWLNAVSAEISPESLEEVRSLPFVSAIDRVDQRLKVLNVLEGNSPDFTSVLDQINAKEIKAQNLDGSGVKIGIIDVGYFGARVNASLKPIFADDRVLGFRDYLQPGNSKPFSNLQSFSNSHGTTVWKMVAGYNKSSNTQYGLATGASYYLARTDHTNYEYRGEEDFWIEAIEWLDSLGVRLVNTSLGYSLGFDDPKENYSPEDMDGKSSKISVAAQIAADEKGMLIIVAAGNEGHDPNWRVVSAPADAKGVISVGATVAGSCAKIRYSALGPDFLNYVKPNIACYSNNGTSFSAPIITGLAACIMQKNPDLTNYQIREVIERSGNLYPYANNYVGYGVPDGDRIIKLLEDIDHDFQRSEQITADTDHFTLSIDSEKEERIVIFHKKNSFAVSGQEEVIHQENQLQIERPENCSRSTIALRDKVIEIIWP